MFIEHQGLSVPVGGLSGSRLSPAQGSGPGVGQNPDWLCLREKRGPCQGSLSAVQLAFMKTHMSLQIGSQRRYQTESLEIVVEIHLHLGRPAKAADRTTSCCKP